MAAVSRDGFSAKFLHLRDGAAMAFRNGLSGFVPLDLLIGFLCGCALCLLVHANAGMPRSIGTAKNTALPAGVHNFKCK